MRQKGASARTSERSRNRARKSWAKRPGTKSARKITVTIDTPLMLSQVPEESIKDLLYELGRCGSSKRLQGYLLTHVVHPYLWQSTPFGCAAAF
eukprot:1158108-Pelagomonas_calceolata.AAC.5